MQFYVFALIISLSLFCFYISNPIKNKIYKNYLLMISIFINFVYTLVIIFHTPAAPSGMKALNLDSNLKISIVIIVAITTLAMNLFETFFIKNFLQKKYEVGLKR